MVLNKCSLTLKLVLVLMLTSCRGADVDTASHGVSSGTQSKCASKNQGSEESCDAPWSDSPEEEDASNLLQTHREVNFHHHASMQAHDKSGDGQNSGLEMKEASEAEKESMISEASKVFMEADFDNSGFLEAPEMQGLQNKFKAQFPVLADTEYWLQYDADSDGRLSSEEFLAAFPKVIAEAEQGPQDEELLDEEDLSEEGKESLGQSSLQQRAGMEEHLEKADAEFEEAELDQSPHISSEVISSEFSKLDTDGDGVLSSSEANAFESLVAQKMPEDSEFHFFDIDKDGSISSDEFAAAIRSYQAHIEEMEADNQTVAEADAKELSLMESSQGDLDAALDAALTLKGSRRRAPSRRRVPSYSANSYYKGTKKSGSGTVCDKKEDVIDQFYLCQNVIRKLKQGPANEQHRGRMNGLPSGCIVRKSDKKWRMQPVNSSNKRATTVGSGNKDWVPICKRGVPNNGCPKSVSKLLQDPHGKPYEQDLKHNQCAYPEIHGLWTTHGVKCCNGKTKSCQKQSNWWCRFFKICKPACHHKCSC